MLLLARQVKHSCTGVILCNLLTTWLTSHFNVSALELLKLSMCVQLISLTAFKFKGDCFQTHPNKGTVVEILILDDAQF